MNNTACFHYFQKRWGLLILLLTFCFCKNTSAQRDYFFRDSTFYPISANATYIAGKRVLYKQNTSSIIPIKDFTIIGDTTYYIRDVDFVNEQKGYVLVGRMYIGGQTYLYKTLDAGTTWTIDSSYFNASERKSINQMQLLNDSLFVLFDGYYTSSLIRSFDGGETWTMWFESLIAHYFQLHKCDDGRWYLIGLPGDGFSSYSFPIPDSLYSKNNLPSFWSGCHNGAPSCIRVYRDGDRDRATDFIAKQIDTLTKVCGIKTAIDETIQQRAITVFPNPASSFCVIKNAKSKKYELYNTLGVLVQSSIAESNEEEIALSEFGNGVYYIVIESSIYKLVIQP
ncbi:MAG: T9SS type A sorting domain-containing protein [Bacteroidia bacterium]|jgi:hypothetical protein|nr:T9SS type A sorting domain-containing protein [Bacteroidia bacterium]